MPPLKSNDKQQPSLPRKVAIYIRVSTYHQVDRDSLPMQRKDLIAYAELLLGISDYEIFEDAGYSGKNTDRPAFQDMMSKIRNREFSHLLVWKIDRISRNLMDFSTMYNELRKLRVTFVSKNEQFDTSTAMGEAMLKIILVFAELERNMTSERVTATMISRAGQGKWNGGKVPYGYNYDPETMEFSIREDEAEICRMIRDDYLKHQSLVHTSRVLNNAGHKTRAGNEWSPTTVWAIVSSPFYAGMYRYNRFHGTTDRTLNPEDEWVTVPDHHPAIFTIEEYEALCSLRETNRRLATEIGQPHKAYNTYVFGGICYCGKCGSRLTSTPGRSLSSGFRTSVYSCPSHRKKGSCDNPSVNDLIIGEFVLNFILNVINAKKSFSDIRSLQTLEKSLLAGTTFNNVSNIDEQGLIDLYNLFTHYHSDGSYVFEIKRTRRKKAAVDPEVEMYRKEIERQERALQRLQDLYLYGNDTMSEKDFMIRKSDIVSKLENASRSLGMVSRDSSTMLTDDEFIRQASHLIITSRLQEKQYINYRNLIQSISPIVMKEYITAIIDNIQTCDGHISCIVFKNGLTIRFLYK